MTTENIIYKPYRDTQNNLKVNLAPGEVGFSTDVSTMVIKSNDGLTTEIFANATTLPSKIDSGNNLPTSGVLLAAEDVFILLTQEANNLPGLYRYDGSNWNAIYPLVTQTNSKGLMSQADKIILDNLDATLDSTIDTRATDITNSLVPDITATTGGKLTNSDAAKFNSIATGAQVNVRANWNQTSVSAGDHIENKPFQTIGSGLSVDSGVLSAPIVNLHDTVIFGSKSLRNQDIVTVWHKGDVAIITATDDKGSYVYNGTENTIGPKADSDFIFLNTPTDVVTSVDGKTGTVELGLSDVATSGSYLDLLNSPTTINSIQTEKLSRLPEFSTDPTVNARKILQVNGSGTDFDLVDQLADPSDASITLVRDSNTNLLVNSGTGGTNFTLNQAGNQTITLGLGLADFGNAGSIGGLTGDSRQKLERINQTNVVTFLNNTERNADGTHAWHKGDIVLITETGLNYVFNQDDTFIPSTTTDTDWDQLLNPPIIETNTNNIQTNTNNISTNTTNIETNTTNISNIVSNVQADYTETDPTAESFIKNKPIPSAAAGEFSTTTNITRDMIVGTTNPTEILPTSVTGPNTPVYSFTMTNSVANFGQTRWANPPQQIVSIVNSGVESQMSAFWMFQTTGSVGSSAAGISWIFTGNFAETDVNLKASAFVNAFNLISTDVSFPDSGDGVSSGRSFIRNSTAYSSGATVFFSKNEGITFSDSAPITLDGTRDDFNLVGTDQFYDDSPIPAGFEYDGNDVFITSGTFVYPTDAETSFPPSLTTSFDYLGKRYFVLSNYTNFTTELFYNFATTILPTPTTYPIGTLVYYDDGTFDGFMKTNDNPTTAVSTDFPRVATFNWKIIT